MTGLAAFEFPNSPFGKLRIKPQGLRQWKLAPSGALHAPVWVPQKISKCPLKTHLSLDEDQRCISAKMRGVGASKNGLKWGKIVAELIVTI
jgi:hypothetical protein